MQIGASDYRHSDAPGLVLRAISYYIEANSLAVAVRCMGVQKSWLDETDAFSLRDQRCRSGGNRKG
jgi:hypothetical protein